ncbi:MAG: hypothetical protein GY714_03905 [Desulfobacterales bacterium]|nr:hypothetical protein [Desulfobacterales bacterium]MCP4161190.1 hypothetical protein [Deltaproteobacteria bacterium]
MTGLSLYSLNKKELQEAIKLSGVRIPINIIKEVKNNNKRKSRNNTIKYEGFKVPKRSVILVGKDYTKLTNKVYKRDGFKCTNPNCTHRINHFNFLTAHHLIKRSKLRLDILKNLISVCLCCHDEIETGDLDVNWIVKGTFLEQPELMKEYI